MIGTQRMYYFTVWIDAPMNILTMIESVQYDFIYDPNPLTIRSQEPGSKFSVRYHGWGCYDTVVVTLQPVDQDAQVQRRSFNMCSVL